MRRYPKTKPARQRAVDALGLLVVRLAARFFQVPISYVALIDHALHGDVVTQSDPAHTTSYIGALQQALRDLSAWAEKGVAPPENTLYKAVNGQVQVPQAAAHRGSACRHRARERQDPRKSENRPAGHPLSSDRDAAPHGAGSLGRMEPRGHRRIHSCCS